MRSKKLEHSRRNVASEASLSVLVIEGTVRDGRWSIHLARYVTDLFEANGHEDGLAFSVSYTSPPNASMDHKRNGLEAALIAIYRKETGESPTANFGQIIPGDRQSSSRRGGRVGGPLSDDQVEPNTERGVEPLPWAHYQNLAHSRWMGLHWTEW